MTETMLNELLVTLPFHLFAYIPFWNNLRFSKRVTALLLIIEQLIYMSIFFISLRAGLSAVTVQLIAIPLYGCLFFFFVKMDWGKVAFLYLFTMDYLMVIRGIAAFLVQTLTGAGYFSLQVGLVTLLLFFLTLPVMQHYFCTAAKMVFNIQAPSIWRVAWILPLFTSLIVILFTYPASEISFRMIFARTALMGCMFLIYYYIVQMFQQLQLQAAAEEHARNMERIVKWQSDQYAILQSRMEETRRARHDLRQHLMVVQGCIDKGDIDTLASYVRKYGESIHVETTYRFCNNYAVDAVLRYYAEKSLASDIDVEIFFQMDGNAIIPEPELCVLLGNLLENAFEACMACENKRFIHVNAQQTGTSMLSLTVDNTCVSPPVWEENRLISNKHEGFGIGTDSVHMIANKYHGDVRFSWREGVFYASVLLNP